jgi:phenylacetic acid degradation operon negative regulatory protein
VRGTTVGRTTGTESPGGRAGPIRDVDLPTRMLVFGVARHDGSIPAAEVFAVAEACHRSTEQVRSCLRRLLAEGLFVREGVGQRATYHPTDDGLRALAGFGGRALQAHAQDSGPRGWDGHWHLVAFAVPEARRTARDALRDQLGALGGAPVHNGLYVSPHPWDKDVVATAEQLGVVDHVTLARTDQLAVGGVSEPRELAARLWPIDDVAARYRTFLDRWSVALDHMSQMQRQRVQLPDSAFLPGALAMALAYRACLDADPLLPADLLPHPWPGREARDLLVSSRRLALRLRAESGRPALFATFDDLLRTLPGDAGSGDAGDDPGSEPEPHEPEDDHDSAAARHSAGGQQ